MMPSVDPRCELQCAQRPRQEPRQMTATEGEPYRRYQRRSSTHRFSSVASLWLLFTVLVSDQRAWCAVVASNPISNLTATTTRRRNATNHQQGRSNVSSSVTRVSYLRKNNQRRAASNSTPVTPRIVGGTTARLGEFPYFVGPPSGRVSVCGATLVAPDMFVQAAHCGSTFENEAIVGAYRFYETGNGATRVTVTRQIVHPDYDGRLTNDIELKKFTPAIPRAQFLRFNTDDRLPRDRTRLVSIGLGKLSDVSGDYPDELQKADVFKVPDDECEDGWGGDITTYLCAWNENPIRQFCDGDSGSPLIDFESRPNPMLVGIASFGSSRTCLSGPSGYTRVATYAGWLTRTICRVSDNPPNYLNCEDVDDDDDDIDDEDDSEDDDDLDACEDPATCDLSDGSDYRGCGVSVTRSGIPCQRWDATFPHQPVFTPETHPGRGLVDNYCRNPDGDTRGNWCYTTDPTVRFDYCDIPECFRVTSPPSRGPVAAPSPAPAPAPTVAPTANPSPNPTGSPTFSGMMTYWGCWIDVESDRTLPFQVPTIPGGFVPGTCASACRDSGFVYSGIQFFGGLCFCGNSLPPPQNQVSPLQCDTACIADRTQNCGGSLKNTIYQVALFATTPTNSPSLQPVRQPTMAPSVSPSLRPTLQPSSVPTPRPQLIWEPTYRGCFADVLTFPRTLPEWVFDNFDQYTAQTCQVACQARRFRFSGIQWPGFCFCGHTLPDSQVGEIECTLPCTSQPLETCGGYLRNAISELPDPAVPLGCFQDFPAPFLTLPYQVPLTQLFDAQSCQNACSARGYRFFGLQFYVSCYCGDFIPPNAAPVDPALCNTPCWANPTQICGGAFLNSIYQIPTVNPSPAYLGCYLDDVLARTLPVWIPGNFIFTPATCSSACLLQGFQYAGVQLFGLCFCGNNLPPVILPETSCNTPCFTDTTQICGGESSNSVYHLPSK